MIIEIPYNKEQLIKLKVLDPKVLDFYLENEYRHLKVYIENKSIIGYIIYDDIYERVELINIFVDKPHRNSKIGSKLLNNLILYARYKKYKNITLEVSTDNIEGLYLYKKYDFKEVARRNNYYGAGVDALLMERDILVEDVVILAIESSCDETSVSIIKNSNIELATSTSTQIDIHEKFGGVVPEIASRQHIKNITFTLEDAVSKAGIKLEDIDAFAVTIGPGLVGALLVGIEAAKTLSLIYDKPLIAVNHMKGHIFGNNLHKEIIYPAITLVISGGHTELIYLSDPYNFYKLGETVDDAVGECYDKVARVMGLSYPGGPKLDKLAQSGKDTYVLPIPMNDDSLNFSYSGLKSAVINLANNEQQRGNEINNANLARSFQNVVLESLMNKTVKALERYQVKTLMLAGGVAANSDIRKSFENLAKERNLEFSSPPIEYCTDNAAMIGSYAYFMYLNNEFSKLEVNAKPALDIF